MILEYLIPSMKREMRNMKKSEECRMNEFIDYLYELIIKYKDEIDTKK